MTIPPDVRGRLIKICGLLSSEYEGERSNAALMATNILRANKTTWEDFLGGTNGADPGRVAWVDPETVQDAVKACLNWPDSFTEWESSFLISVSGRDRLSEKQQRVLSRLVDKAAAAARVHQHG